MTFDKKLNSVDACVTSKSLYFRAQTPTYLFSIKTDTTIRTK